MIEIEDVTLSKNPCNANERIVISIDIVEILDYPYNYPHDYPISSETR